MTDNNLKTKDSSHMTQPPTLSIKKIKTEDSPNRLPSLRGPRDLTLGGIKKKTFAPNIPVRKNRVKVETIDDKSPKPRSEKRSRSNNSRGRGRGRGARSQVIQQHSIFEAGPGLPSAGRGRGGARASDQQSSAQMQKPTIKKEKIDFAKEKAESDDVMRKLNEGNMSIISDLHNDENLAPMILPLSSDQTANSGRDVAALFRGNQHKLMLMQIPDSLPGVCASEDDLAEEKKMKREAVDKSQADSRAGVDRLADGFVGKLQILKSGRCRLLLGGLNFDVKMGTTPTFSQEIVSVRVPQDDDPESKGHLSVLDEVSSKLVCVPDVKALIHSA